MADENERPERPGEDKNEATSDLNYKPLVPGEPCTHPPEHRLKEKGRIIGLVQVCRLCGQVVGKED